MVTILYIFITPYHNFGRKCLNDVSQSNTSKSQSLKTVKNTKKPYANNTFLLKYK